jgi:enoyl-CoA hydratase/carnithine racemase
MTIDLDIDWQGDVAVLHWRDGENRFNRESITTLGARLDEAEAKAGDDGPLAVVLTGEGKFFSNGLDLDWLGSAGDEGAGFLDDVHRLFGRLLLFPAPVVGAVNGHAFAGGAMLACALDFCVMREDRGYWCLPEIDLGLPLTPAMHATVATKLPRVTCNEAILTGRRYAAADALAAGIVHRTAPEADVLPTAVALATELAPKSRTVFAEHKRLSNGAAAAICRGEQPA